MLSTRCHPVLTNRVLSAGLGWDTYCDARSVLVYKATYVKIKEKSEIFRYIFIYNINCKIRLQCTLTDVTYVQSDPRKHLY